MPSENEIRDINLFGDIKSIKQMAFDAAHPIGETYVQYPQQDDPMTIYNKNGVTSVWEEQLQYNGAFFRSGNALSTVWKVDDEDGYYTINGDVVTPVKVVADNGGTITIGSATASAPRTIDGKTYKEYSVNGYSNAAAGYINKTNLLSIQEDTIKETEINVSGARHRHSIPYYTQNGSGEGAPTTEHNTKNASVMGRWNSDYTPSDSSGVLTMSGTIGAGNTETRPENYTFKIWKRIA